MESAAPRRKNDAGEIIKAGSRLKHVFAMRHRLRATTLDCGG
jgi:hypothetical protein